MIDKATIIKTFNEGGFSGKPIKAAATLPDLISYFQEQLPELLDNADQQPASNITIRLMTLGLKMLTLSITTPEMLELERLIAIWKAENNPNPGS